MKELFQHVLQNVLDSHMVGITIQNQVNQSGTTIGTSFSRKDRLSGAVLWSVFEKVSHSHTTFDALDTLVITVHSVMRTAGFCRAMKTVGRPLSIMAHVTESLVDVKAVDNSLPNVLIISIAKVDKDSNYKRYRNGWKIRPVLRKLLETISISSIWSAISRPVAH